MTSLLLGKWQQEVATVTKEVPSVTKEVSIDVK